MSDVKKMRTIKFVVLCNWRVASIASMPEVKKMRAVYCCVTEGLLASAHTSDVKKRRGPGVVLRKDPGLLPVTVVQHTDFDVIIGQSAVSDRNLACAILIRHKKLSDGNVKVRFHSK